MAFFPVMLLTECLTQPVAPVWLDIAPGSGRSVGVGDVVTVRLTLRAGDGTVLVDTARRGLTYTLVAGDGSSHPWALALTGMKVGGQRKVQVEAAERPGAWLNVKVVRVEPQQ